MDVLSPPTILCLVGAGEASMEKFPVVKFIQMTIVQHGQGKPMLHRVVNVQLLNLLCAVGPGT